MTKKKFSVKKLSLAMSVIIASLVMIVFILSFCAISASLILKGSLKDDHLRIISNAIIILSSFVGTRIVLKNKTNYIAVAAYTACVILLMLFCVVVLNVNIGDFVPFIVFTVVGSVSGILIEYLKPKKSHFQKKRYC